MDKNQLHASVHPRFLPEHPIRVVPAELKGVVTPPPSKSVAHRAMICAALSGASTWYEAIAGVDGPLSDDLRATFVALLALTQPAAAEKVTTATGEVVVIDCYESGSTLRFLIPLALALGVPCQFIGRGQLPERPLREFKDIFQNQPITLEFPSAGCNLPLVVSGRLKGDAYRVPGHISSQYISGLLLALPMTGAAATVELTSPLQSGPYVDLTMDVMRDFGVRVEWDSELGSYGGYRIPGGQRYQLPAEPYLVEADFSQAAFWLVAGFITHDIGIKGLNLNSRQGDRGVINILERLAKIRENHEGNLRVDMQDMPDVVPILTVAAAAVPGAHVFYNVKRLRLKECDRLTATMELLRGIGVRTRYDETADELTVFGIGLYDILEGQKPGTAMVSCRSDHRMAMTQAIAGVCSQHGVVIDEPSCVAKSWPDFFVELVKLGGVFVEEQ
ncbi:MAG TPA: 3-phosphoshikimate 1-carboxyvinyltransferase [Clostridiaceae bacterium]|nr:3-phosphoshikimate 1-carboxyvinyltransferase [Clostridiaceae bacterium]